MSHQSFSEIIARALPCANKPTQPDGPSFDPDRLEIIGDVPLPARHLSCLIHSRANTIQQLHETVAFARDLGDTAQAAKVSNKIDRLLEQTGVLSQLILAILQDEFPDQCQNYSELVIVENWKVAGAVACTDLDGFPPDVHAMMAGLGITDSAHIKIFRSATE